MSDLSMQLFALTRALRPIDEQIVDLLAEATEPMGIADLAVRLTGSLVSRETLRERLNQMVATRRIAAVTLRAAGAAQSVRFVSILREHAFQLDQIAPSAAAMRRGKVLAEIEAAGAAGISRGDLVKRLPELKRHQIDVSIQWLTAHRLAHHKVRQLVAGQRSRAA